MSKELDDRLTALRERFVADANIPISMSNYKQKLRTNQEMFLELIKIVDGVNEDADTVSADELAAFRKAVDAAMAKGEQ